MGNVSFFNYDSAFATRLRKLIEENNISKNQLSEEIGVSRQAISQYCDGSTIPNADKLLKIAEFFNVSLDYLVGRTENFTTDDKLRFVCDYTGLNQNTVEYLREAIQHSKAHELLGVDSDFIYNLPKMINLMFSDEHFVKMFCSNFINYIDEDANKERFYYIYSQGNIPLGLDFTNLYLMGMQQQLKAFKDNYLEKQHQTITKQEGTNNAND